MSSNNEVDKTEVEEASKKKRGAEKEMRKEEVDSGSDSEKEESEGTWKRANENILANRRKVKVRRGNSVVEESNAKTEEEKKSETQEEKKEDNKEEKKEEKTETSGFTFNFASPPAFNFNTNFNFSSSNFNFATSFAFASSSSGSTTSAPSSTSSANSIFGLNIAPPTATSTAPPFEKAEESDDNPTLPEKVEKSDLPNLPVHTGEEDETHAFQSKAKLFILDTAANKWNERGLGQLRLNVSKDKSSARLLMRVEASLRLILNVSLFASMKVEKNGDKAVKFTGPALDKENEICIYCIRLASADLVEQLMTAIENNKPKADKVVEKTATTTTTSASEEEKAENSEKN